MLPIIPFLVSLFLAFLSGTLLFSNTVINGLISTLINVGLDTLRAQFIAALIMVAGTAFISATLGRHKGGALVGAGIVFLVGYLLGFLRLELQPVYDPGGLLEPLNSGALVHTSLTMTALALLCAFIGASVGVSCAEVLLDPLYQLAHLAWWRFIRQRESATAGKEAATTSDASSQVKRVIQILTPWLSAGMMIVLLVLASDSSNLFVFSPDVGLHEPPNISTGKGGLVHGTIVQDSVVSPALKGQRKPFLVYLPPSYNTPQGKTKHYPVLYLLHGSPGKDSDWITGGRANESADTLIATEAIPELIMILPDGNGRPGATSEWGNSFDQRQRIETYVAVDLVKYVDQHYRTLPDSTHRAIGGLSMGGFGAMNIAVHHPDIFATVISLGGYYYAEGPIWGNNIVYMQQNSPAAVLPHDRQAWKLHIYLGAATHDQPYYTDTRNFMQELDALHIPYRFDLQPGYHSWSVWQVQMYHALKWIKWR
jgi:S-formylglutathione hydrolase FrmB